MTIGLDATSLRGSYGLFWTPVSGEPGFEPPEFSGSVVPFVIGETLAIAGAIGLMAAGGIVGNRADALVVALARRLPVRQRDREPKVPDRNIALVSSVIAISQQWPGSVRPAAVFAANVESHVHVLSEGVTARGDWSFKFRILDVVANFQDPANAPHYQDDWIYDVTVHPPAPRAAIRMSDVYRRVERPPTK